MTKSVSSNHGRWLAAAMLALLVPSLQAQQEDESRVGPAGPYRSKMRIVEDPSTFGHCMCLGDPAIELYEKRKKVATIGFHHGRSIRWQRKRAAGPI